MIRKTLTILCIGVAVGITAVAFKSTGTRIVYEAWNTANCQVTINIAGGHAQITHVTFAEPDYSVIRKALHEGCKSIFVSTRMNYKRARRIEYGHIRRGFYGERYTSYSIYGCIDPTVVGFPMWALLIACCAYPAIALYLGPIRRRFRRDLGVCTKCAYSLHGLTDPRCPECGTPFDDKLLKKNA